MPTSFTRKTAVPDEVRLFHITHVDNLASILEQGLLSLNELLVREIARRNIAFQHLQDRREEIEVTVGGGGHLHDYVPFQFAARSPMLYAIASGGLETPASQNDIVHLYTTVGHIREADLGFVWSDGHPLASFSKFSDDLQILPTALDWESLLSRWWNNTIDNPDRKRKRQAEFLVHRVLPWECVRGIAVRNQATRQKVEKLLEGALHQPKIAALPEWYYD